ncbi:unnamed protein product [Mytilus coruscus]|uniref:Uncharacterized protein n=1 Tax=Mytilus coruscus TaxID=42192 RepID=A0A6J8D863_MYTCO|nr:unnamed protein product [Mytilus coruscus]
MKNLETQSGGKCKGEVRLLYYDLLTKGVSANTIQSVVRSVLENMTEYDTTKLKLPSRSTAQRMVTEAGELENAKWLIPLLPRQSENPEQQLINQPAETDCQRSGGSNGSGDQILMSLIRIENTVNENGEMLRRLINRDTSNYGDTDLEDLVPVSIPEDNECEDLQTRLKNTL